MSTIAFWVAVAFVVLTMAALIYGFGVAVWYVEHLPPPALP